MRTGIGPWAAVLCSAAWLGCQRNPAAAPSNASSQAQAAENAHVLALQALVCMLGPMVDEAPPTATDAGGSLEPASASCIDVIKLVDVPPLALHGLDKRAVADVRHAIANGVRQAESKDLLTFFNRGVEAVAEGRMAHHALLSPPLPTTASLDRVRKHPKLDALHQLSFQMPDPLGAEARALATLIAASHFVHQARWQPAGQAYAAEPLFAIMIGKDFAAGERTLDPWERYLASAARQVQTESAATTEAGEPEPRAVGGGPVDSNESACARIGAAVRRELRDESRHVAGTALASALDQMIRHVSAMDPSCGLSQPPTEGRADGEKQTGEADTSERDRR